MKNKQFDFRKLKKDLYFRKSKGQKFVIWNLSKEQIEYVISLGYNITVELYQIVTKSFMNPSSINGILKDLHYSRKKGKKVIVRKLKKDQIKMLNKYEIRYKPIKYKIFLN